MATTLILKPNADGTTQWFYGGNHWQSLVAVGGGYIDADYTSTNDIDQCYYDSTQNVRIVTDIWWWTYAASVGANNKQPFGNVYLGGWLGEKQYSGFTNTEFNWKVLHWGGLSATQAELNGMLHQYRCPAVMGKGDLIRCDACAIWVSVEFANVGRKLNRNLGGRVNDGIN